MAVVDAIREVLLNHPDPAQEARECEDHECAKRKLEGMAKQDLREKLQLISDSCFEAVESVMDGSRQVCQAFKRLRQKKCM